MKITRDTNMKKILVGLICASVFAASAADVAEIAKKALPKVVSNTISMTADNGFIYSRNELEHLSKGALTGGKIVNVSKCANKKNAVPGVALKDFSDQLKSLNIQLIVVPVPPKAAIYPFGEFNAGEAMMYLRPYYDELRNQGIKVLDPSEIFLKDASPNVYCHTDAHWSPRGIALVADELAKQILPHGDVKFTVTSVKTEIIGDLAKSLSSVQPEKETLNLESVTEAVFDEKSPVLVIGDSHTLIFSSGGDMLAEKSGLCEALATRIGMPVERIGVKGSAATAVRVNLYRKAAKDPAWIKGKKFVIYCFSCREFTEATSGWLKIPVMKK